MKRCYKCGEVRENTEFWTGQSICKVCGRRRNKEYKKHRAEQMKALPPDAFVGLSKQCTGCGATKPVEEFPPSTSGQFGRRSKCSACEARAKVALYHRHHPDAPFHHRPHFSEELGAMVKRCPQCQTEKPMTEFYRVHDGHQAPCKGCHKTDQKARYQANPDLYRARSREWACAHSDEERERHQSYYEANRARLVAYYREYNDEHRQERRAYDRIRHAKETPESRRRQYLRYRNRYILRARLYRQAHPDRVYNHRQIRRARMLGATRYEVIQRQEVITRDGATCYLCGHICTPGVDLTLDHVIPLSRGGTHTRDNIRVCCWPCNSAKGTKMLEEM